MMYRDNCKYTDNGTAECGTWAECYLKCPGLKERAKQLWEELRNVPINTETECIEETWKDFPKGTHRETIWRWFEEKFDVNVAKDLMYAR